MANPHRKNLFNVHVTSLREILPNIDEVFICPICFEIFGPENIKNDSVDTGHVWPKYLRQYGEQAKHQQILLCKKCNSMAGSYGDELMQIDAQINEGVKTGDLRLRNLRVTSSLRDKEALLLQAFVKKLDEKNLQLMFPQPKEQKERQRVEELVKKFYEYGEQSTINITMYPPRGTSKKPFGDPKNRLLAQAGLLTSAYLLVFYLCGYGYIFQSCLDPVRKYIKSSFKKQVDDRLDFQESKDMCVQVCSDPTHFCVEPEIYFVIPISEEIPLHQEIRFLSYHIRLPVPPKIKDVDRQSLILQFLGEDGLSAQNGQTLHAISFIGVMSELDHPMLEKLMLLVK